MVERLLKDAGAVVVIEMDPASSDWIDTHPAGSRIVAVVGDASNEGVAERAADRAEEKGILTGWVNNAAVFRDASLHEAPAHEILEIIQLNLAPAVVGCATAVRRFIDSNKGGAIVNVSSHQARRAIPGALPYVTAKAAVEGLTRALAVDYGPLGVRTNAVALGSITTARYETLFVSSHQRRPSGSRTRCDRCTRWGESAVPRRSHRWSPIYSRTKPASSMA